MVYELDTWSRGYNTDFIMKNCLFGSKKLTKNFDPDKYKHSGYDQGFDSRSEFTLPDASMGKNVINFGVDMSSSVHIVNKKKDILILCKDPTTVFYLLMLQKYINSKQNRVKNYTTIHLRLD